MEYLNPWAVVVIAAFVVGVLSRIISMKSIENNRLHSVIDRGAKAWLSLEPGVKWEGDLGDAMVAAVAAIEGLRARCEDDE